MTWNFEDRLWVTHDFIEYATPRILEEGEGWLAMHDLAMTALYTTKPHPTMERTLECALVAVSPGNVEGRKLADAYERYRAGSAVDVPKARDGKRYPITFEHAWGRQ